YLVEARGFTYVQAGQVASVANIGGIPGCIAIGALSDKLEQRRTPIIAFSATYTFLLFMFLFMPTYFPIHIFAVIAFLISFSISFWVLFFSIIPEILPLEKAGIGLGLVNGLGTIGFSLVTPLYGGLVDVTQTYLSSNLLLLGGAVLMTLIFVVLIEETYITNDNK
ncbi:MAG: MFS transporter, partial [Candidatus Bathyarchaeia archaeon]